MGLLGCLDGFKIGELEALAQRWDDRPRQARAVLVKPERGRLNGSLPVCETLGNALI